MKIGVGLALVWCVGAAVIALPGCGKKPSGESSEPRGEAPSKAEDKGGGTVADIAECKAHLQRLTDCGEAESLVTKRRDELQKKIDKGTSKTIIAESCKTMDKVFTCKGGKGNTGAGATGADDKKEDPPKSADAPKRDDSGASADELGVKICDDYVKTVRACPSTKNTKPLDTLVEKWKKSLAEGKKGDVEAACEKATKLFKCKG